MIPGETYTFKVQSRTIFGFSDYSVEESILAAQVPAKAEAPTTQVVDPAREVLISWVAPDSMGAQINGYRISIIGIDGEGYPYTQDECQDYDNPAMVESQSCTVPIYILMEYPYNLPWGSSIRASVIAYNDFGDSDESDFGNGAIITTSPDSPYDLQDVEELRTPSTLTFTWKEGPANGGATVTSYRVWYDQSIDKWLILDSAVTQTKYTVTGLEFGRNYKFKVEARNSYSLS